MHAKSKVDDEDKKVFHCYLYLWCAEYFQVELRDIVLRDTNVQTERLKGARMVHGMNGMAGYGPVVQGRPDGRSLPSVVDERPDEKLKSGRIRRIPLLTGVTKHETARRLDLPEIRSVFQNATSFLGALSNSLSLGGLLQGSVSEKVDLLGVGKTYIAGPSIIITRNINCRESLKSCRLHTYSF